MEYLAGMDITSNECPRANMRTSSDYDRRIAANGTETFNGGFNEVLGNS